MNFFVIKMPVNSKGLLENDPNKVVKVQWEIWEAGNFRTVVSFDNEEEAQTYCNTLNRKFEVDRVRL